MGKTLIIRLYRGCLVIFALLFTLLAAVPPAAAAVIVKDYPTIDPTAPLDITMGSDGNLWFTVPAENKIGKISTAGTYLDEYTVPTTNSSPNSITAGPDGNIWFTENAGNKIGKMIANGVFLGPAGVRLAPALTTLSLIQAPMY